MSVVYDELSLYTTPEKFYIEPTSNPDNTLVIDRVTQSVIVKGSREEIPPTASKQTIYGIIGLISLVAGPYLVVVTGRTKLGVIGRQEIYRLESVDILSYSRSKTHLSDNQTRIEKEYITMLENVLATPHFYFSYTYDLSHTVQRLHDTSPDFLRTPLYQRGEQKYIWNEYLLNEFVKTSSHDLADFCLPIILGYVSITHCVLNGKTFTLILVSRRSKERAGMRLFTRGIDARGHVANFVETEQIVETSNERASFVQTRGSMPFFWQQYPNLKYKPRPAVLQSENHLEAFIRHFESQIIDYGRQVIVNLVDHRGSEGKLEEFYRKLVNDVGNPNIKYEAFDFHKECSKMRWDRLQILTDRLTHDLEQMSVMLTIDGGVLVSQQEGVFRTNCIDCLDRTNVLQSMLARISLNNVLQKLNILRPGQRVEDQIGLERIFKSIWSDHADLISIQYSGTGALKTDFTRTGKRSHAGAFKDGLNSIIRYYKNNFQHGFRQDALDVWLGQYKVSAGEGMLVMSPLEGTRGWKYTTFPLILLVAIAMFFANLISPSEYSSGTLLCLLFWGSMIAATFSVIFYYGTEYVDQPRLCSQSLSSA